MTAKKKKIIITYISKKKLLFVQCHDQGCDSIVKSEGYFISRTAQQITSIKYVN